MKTRNILIVEDNYLVAETLSRALRREFAGEFGVDVCHTAETGLQMFETKSFDLLITDWHLPDMSGLDLIFQVRQEHPDIKIIFMTAYPMEQIENHVREIADFYLLKPFQIPVLMGHIHQLLSPTTHPPSGDSPQTWNYSSWTNSLGMD